ncbi:hypothetical protein M8J76_016549 [Diaphorina citri]|nr:hypothetical protein M8J76_006019 [Diaphorina citri]KAI5730701.1 hypothetical protein M8J76_016549 [Diaphorina citri]KAI5734856.1 hypothetical protein M8J77_011266 [Diaphorina citri]
MAEGQDNNKRRHSQVSMSSDENSSVPLKNRFKPLSDMMEDDSISDPSPAAGPSRATGPVQSPSQRPRKDVKPPPLVVDGVFGSDNTAIQTLKKQLKENFEYKYRLGKTHFYTHSEEDFKLLKTYLTEKQFQFHTFTLQTEKLVKIVLRGLPPTISEDDIKEELNDLGHKVEKVHQLSKNPQYPVYSLLFSPGTVLSNIFKIKTLCYCVVSWEKPHKKTNPTQCYRCQKFHHVANNCTRQKKCVKCSGDHHVKECNQEEELCANCNEHHSANSKVCEVYKKVSKHNTRPPPPPRVSNPGTQYPSQGAWPRLRTPPTTMAALFSQSPTSQPPTPAPHSPPEVQGGFGNILQELKSLFGGFNFPKILSSLKSMFEKIKNASDGFSKFTILLDSVCELFDG